MSAGKTSTLARTGAAGGAGGGAGAWAGATPAKATKLPARVRRDKSRLRIPRCPFRVRADVLRATSAMKDQTVQTSTGDDRSGDTLAGACQDRLGARVLGFHDHEPGPVRHRDSPGDDAVDAIDRDTHPHANKEEQHHVLD